MRFMQVATTTGERQAKLLELPIPEPKADWVVVKVHTAPMCTEYKSYLAKESNDCLGHEAAGEVVALGYEGPVAVGQRVVVMPSNLCGRCEFCLSGNYIHCQNQTDFASYHGSNIGRATYAQYLLKPASLLVPIPETLSYDHAAMSCCGLGPSFGAMQKMQLSALDTVLITGLGPVGLGAVINAVYRGASVIAVESQPYRAKLALELGAGTVINPNQGDALEQILALTDGRGVDKALDCSGVVAAHRLCIDATRRLGTVAFIGESHADTPLRISNDMIRKGLNLFGSWHYNLAESPRLIQLIGKLGPQLDKLISHRFPLSQVQEAWELQITGNCAKVLLKPWEG